MEKLIGAGIVTASIALYALLYPLLKKANQELPPLTIMALSMLVLFLLSALGSIFLEHSLQIKQNIIKSHVTTLIIVGVVNFFAFWLAIYGFKYFPVWQQNMFYLLSPIFAGIFAYFLLGEKISANLFIGLAIMGVGLFIALR